MEGDNQQNPLNYRLGDFVGSIEKTFLKMETQIEGLRSETRKQAEQGIKIESCLNHLSATLKDLTQETKDRRLQMDGLGDSLRQAIEQESFRLKADIKEVFQSTEILEEKMADLEAKYRVIESRQAWIIAIASTIIMTIIGSGIFVLNIENDENQHRPTSDKMSFLNFRRKF